MKITIEINEESYVQSYLSILSIGMLECLEKKIITYEDAMDLLYLPGLIDKFEEKLPMLGEAVHLGTELEDVEDLIPDKLQESIDQIRMININSIKFLGDYNKQHVFYRLSD